jgi:ribosomal protein L16 Arg81 hydroxylase
VSTRSSAILDLRDLITPVDPAIFLEDYWEKKPLVLKRNDRSRYRGLFSTADVDFVLSSLSRPVAGQTTMASLIVNGQVVPVSLSDELHNGTGMVNTLLRRFVCGATLLIERVERFSDSLLLLCQNLERSLRARIGVNLYLTPESAQGFKAHFDPHDVFIVQISGGKRWRLYGSPLPLPLAGMPPLLSSDALGDPEEVEVEEGDLLYIPRGCVHEAHTGATHSLHLTVGITTPKWVDVVAEALADAAARDERFRRSLPAVVVGGDDKLSSIADQFSALVAVLAETDVAAVFDRVGERWEKPPTPSLSDVLGGPSSEKLSERSDNR